MNIYGCVAKSTKFKVQRFFFSQLSLYRTMATVYRSINFHRKAALFTHYAARWAIEIAKTDQEKYHVSSAVVVHLEELGTPHPPTHHPHTYTHHTYAHMHTYTHNAHTHAHIHTHAHLYTCTSCRLSVGSWATLEQIKPLLSESILLGRVLSGWMTSIVLGMRVLWHRVLLTDGQSITVHMWRTQVLYVQVGGPA